MAVVGVPLQVGVLLGAFHHVEQRLYADGTPARIFHEQRLLGEKPLFKPVDVQLKFAVNNLFNEDYLSVLSRPMPGINFELFIGITPKFGKNKKKSVNTNL